MEFFCFVFLRERNVRTDYCTCTGKKVNKPLERKGSSSNGGWSTKLSFRNSISLFCPSFSSCLSREVCRLIGRLLDFNSSVIKKAKKITACPKNEEWTDLKARSYHVLDSLETDKAQRTAGEKNSADWNYLQNLT